MRKFLCRFVALCALLLPMPIAVFMLSFFDVDGKPGRALVRFLSGWWKVFKSGGEA